jgi:hypothetical protein
MNLEPLPVTHSAVIQESYRDDILAIIPILNADRDLAGNLFLGAVRGTSEEVVRPH